MNMTTGTIEDPLREGHLLAMSTGATGLTRIGRIDFDKLSASLFRFARELTQEGRPRGICNAFRQTMIMGHAIDHQVLNGYHAVAIDDLAAFLVREVVAPELDPLMHPRHSFAVRAALRRALCQLRMLALDFCQRLFFLAEKARVLNLGSIRKGRKGYQSDINPNVLMALRQALRFALNREAGVPFPGAAFLDGEGLDLAPNRAVQEDFDTPDARQGKLALCIDLEPELRIGETIVAASAFETRVAWVLTGLDAPEKGFESQIKPDGHVLQDLGMHALERGTFLFQCWIGRVLLVERQALASLLIGIAPVCKQVVIEPTTFFQGIVELGFLLFRRIDPVLKHLTHPYIMRLNTRGVKKEAAIHPQP